MDDRDEFAALRSSLAAAKERHADYRKWSASMTYGEIEDLLTAAEERDTLRVRCENLEMEADALGKEADDERARAEAAEQECAKAERLWKEASIDASRKHSTIKGLERAVEIERARAERLAALLRSVARAPYLSPDQIANINAALAAEPEKP